MKSIHFLINLLPGLIMATALDGNWTQFTNWTTCSKTCGGKIINKSCRVEWDGRRGSGRVQIRHRSSEERTARASGWTFKIVWRSRTVRLIVNGGWSNFTEWTICSQTCGNGTKERSRTCTQPKPQFGGEECMGQDKETESCFLENCRESIFIESTGAAAEWQGDNMGRFDRIDRQENRRPVYAQRAGLMFLYHHRGTGSWRVGSPVGSYTAALMVRSTNLVPPARGWQYWDEGKWHTDSTLWLMSPPDPSSVCTSIQVYSAGPAGTAQWEYMGSYRWEGEWLNGHKVFVGGRGNNRYLRVATGSSNWDITDTKDFPLAAIESGRATSCPCNKGAGPSSRDGRDWWTYVDAGGEWQEDESIEVICV